MGIAKLKNVSSVDITYTLEWEGGLNENDVIKPNEVIEVNCGDDKAILCHRSDGGIYGVCPNDSKTLQSDDEYYLLENGEYEN